MIRRVLIGLAAGAPIIAAAVMLFGPAAPNGPVAPALDRKPAPAPIDLSRVPAPPEEPAGRAVGHRSSPHLPPLPPDPSIDPDIRFADVRVREAAARPAPGQGGRAVLSGRLRYEGAEAALPHIELRAVRYSLADGRWTSAPASRRHRLAAVPGATWIDFHVPLNVAASQMTHFALVGHNPQLTAENKTSWVPLRAESLDCAIDRDGASVTGSLVNGGDKAVFAYRVAVEFSDLNGEWIESLNGEALHDGTGDPWGPGAVIPFSLKSRLHAASVSPHPSARAIGRVK